MAEVRRAEALTAAMGRPEWLDGLTHKDWLLDGHAIRGERMLAMWNALDWSRAYMDMGPSPAGNLGPYWHVPLTFEQNYSVHRLYPKLQTKWLMVVRRAIQEDSAPVPGQESAVA